MINVLCIFISQFNLIVNQIKEDIKMKRMTSVLLVCLLSIFLSAGNKENLNYVQTGDNVYFGCNIRSGLLNTRVINSEGDIYQIRNKDINRMVKDGHLYEKMPLSLENDKKTTTAMMEFVCQKNDLRLYKYTCVKGYCDFSNGIVDERQSRDFYFVFRDGKFHLLIDANNAEAILPYFGISIKV
jgi:hypothetical protein